MWEDNCRTRSLAAVVRARLYVRYIFDIKAEKGGWGAI